MNDPLGRPTRRGVIGLGFGAAVGLWAHPARAESLDTLEGAAFGTTWSIIGPAAAELDRIRPEIERLFDEIDKQMSPWRSDSTLSRFNAAPAGIHPAETELINVAACALDLAEQSMGAFDPTVGPLVARWGFGPIAGSEVPDWRGISVSESGLSKARDGLTLDLCGIAKGRALDRAAEIAVDAGASDVLFDIGGELKAVGRHPSGRPWHVAVDAPWQGGAAPAILRLPAGMSVATSGQRYQSYGLGDRSYGHIINPASRAPADDVLRSVTVLASDAMRADGWATALFAAGPVDGPRLAQALGIAALFVVGTGAVSEQIMTGQIGKVLF